MKKKTILLVDDNADFRQSVRDILIDEVYRVIDVEDGKYALPVIEKEQIDLLITDILMPDVDGIELAIGTKVLKTDLKIIGMSVKSTRSNNFFEHIFSKPFTMEDLIANVEVVLSS